MRKFIFTIPTILLTTLLLTSCGKSSPYSVELYKLYESPTEIYLELNVKDETTYYEDNYGVYDNEYAYNLAVFDKDTRELTIIDDREQTDYRNIVNYTTRSSFKERKYMSESTTSGFTNHLNNPVFYNRNHEVYFDIRTNEIVELSDECSDTRNNNYTCNILDGDIQVVLDKNEDNTFDLSISNYVSGVEFTSFSFTGDNVTSDLYSKVISYDNYDENKIGIEISFHDLEPRNVYYGDENHIQTIIFEYSYDTNTIEELYRGTEYIGYDFGEPESCFSIVKDFIPNESITSYWGGGYSTYTLYDTCNDEVVLFLDPFSEDIINAVKAIYED